MMWAVVLALVFGIVILATKVDKLDGRQRKQSLGPDDSIPRTGVDGARLSPTETGGDPLIKTDNKVSDGVRRRPAHERKLYPGPARKAIDNAELEAIRNTDSVGTHSLATADLKPVATNGHQQRLGFKF